MKVGRDIRQRQGFRAKRKLNWRKVGEGAVIAGITGGLAVGGWYANKALPIWFRHMSVKKKLETKAAMERNPKKYLKELFGVEGALADSVLAKSNSMRAYWNPKERLSFIRLLYAIAEGDTSNYFISNNLVEADNAALKGNIQRQIRFENIAEILRWAKTKPELVKALKDPNPAREGSRKFLRGLINAEDSARNEAKKKTEKALRQQQERRTSGILKARKGTHV